MHNLTGQCLGCVAAPAIKNSGPYHTEKYFHQKPRITGRKSARRHLLLHYPFHQPYDAVASALPVAFLFSARFMFETVYQSDKETALPKIDKDLSCSFL